VYHLVATLGFDEKFTIRFVMRYVGRFSDLSVVTAEPMDERAAKALRSVEDFITRFVGGARVSVITVNPLNVHDSVARLKEVFKRYEEYVINLSGGMRALIIELLLAAVLARARGEIEIELENFSGVVTIPLKVFTHYLLSSDEVVVVKTLLKLGSATAKELVKESGLPRSTLYRCLKALVGKGLVKASKVDKTNIYSPADIAKMLA